MSKPKKPSFLAPLLAVWMSFGAMVGGAAPAVAEATPSPPSKELQIAGAVLAAPEDQRDAATVLGYDHQRNLVPLRKGDGDFICLADDPAKERFHVACYHRSLGPFMARGRELTAEGKGADRHRIRNEEAAAGKLELPRFPAALFHFTVDEDKVDLEAGTVEGANRVYVIYMPNATAESTGFPSAPNPKEPSAPWIMRAGTPSAHVMITPGPEGGSP